MATSVAEQLVEDLRDSGVQRIYGLVGDSLNPWSETCFPVAGSLPP